MIRPLSAHLTKQISSQNLAYSKEQNPQITIVDSSSHAKNKTEYYRQQSDYIINKQEKLIQLLISVRLLQMGFDWRDNIRQIEKKIHQNRDISIQDVPRIVNQLVPQLINNKNKNNEQAFSVIPQFELKRQSRNESLSSLKIQRNMKKKGGTQIVLVGKQLKLCPICCIQTYEYIKLPCQHIFCKSCIILTIKQDLNTARYDAVCPDYGCGTAMPDSIIQQLLEKNLYDRLMHFRAKQALQRNPHNKFCSIPDCGQLLEDRYNHLQCKKCRKQYCKHCLQQAHDNNCDQQLLKKLRSMYQAHKIKKCPKCKSPIQKIDGCNHMTCTKCQYGFCWICLSQYTDHHYRYYNCFGCPGMQFEDQSEIAIERVKQVCFFIFLPLLLLIAIIILLIFLPIFVIMTFLLKPCSWAHEYQNKCQTKLLLDTICCCCCSDSFKTFLAYFILLPRSLVYAVFVAPFQLLCLLFNEIMGSMY